MVLGDLVGAQRVTTWISPWRRISPLRLPPAGWCGVLLGSCKVSKSGRGKTGRLTKCRGKRTRLVEAHRESDLRDRERRGGQQKLGALGAPAGVITVGWHAEG